MDSIYDFTQITSLPNIIQDHHSISWLYWFVHSEDTIMEWSLTVPLGHYFKLAFFESISGIFHSVLVNMCEGILSELFPGLEREAMFGFEYFWRGLQGHNLPPKEPIPIGIPTTAIGKSEYIDWSIFGFEHVWRGLQGNNLPPKEQIPIGTPATAIGYSKYLEWSAVCHPAVEYNKDKSFWTPRMFAAEEMSKQIIPRLSIFLVDLGLGFYSASYGKITPRQLASRFWKGFYGWSGGLAGVAAGGAVASFSSVRAALSPLSRLPFIGPSIMGYIPDICGAALSWLVLGLVLPVLWPWNEDDDSPTIDFQTARKSENERREMVYGKVNAKFARPPTFAPISPHFLHPELGRRYNAIVFPERVPPPATETPREEDEVERDHLAKLRIELRKSRMRNVATSSRPVSVPITPIASRTHSRTASAESESESDSDSDSGSYSGSTSESTTAEDTSSIEETESTDEEETSSSDESESSESDEASSEGSSEDEDSESD